MALLLFYFLGLRDWRLFVAGLVAWVPLALLTSPLVRLMTPARLEAYVPRVSGLPLRGMISIFPADDAPERDSKSAHGNPPNSNQ